MARQSAAHKAETHQKILEHASQSFRANGSSVGIGDVMHDLGLTHGGFYRHFDSKDELFIEAVAVSFAEIGDRLEKAAETAVHGKHLEAIIYAYLSQNHARHPGLGCTLSTLAADIARQPSAVRKRISLPFQLFMERMSKYMPGATAAEQRDNGVILFSGMAGAMTLARAFGNLETQDAMLKLSRDFYLQNFK